MFRSLTTLFYYFSLLQGIPINVKISDFEDTWNYKISPQNEPVLLESAHHTLPIFLESELNEKRNEQAANYSSSSDFGDYIKRKISCPVCKLGALLLQTEVKKGTSVSDIRDKFIAICVGFKVENEIVCTGVFDVFAPDLLPAINLTQIGPPQLCSLMLGSICEGIDNPLHEWELEFPNVPKPAVKTSQLYAEKAPVLKVLHLSDTHFDVNYAEGSPSNCMEPLCCHPYSTMEEGVEPKPAGKWGSYEKCDTPEILIQHMLRHIGEEHKDIDYIIWTGDLPPHDVWNQTKSGNIENLKASVKHMTQAFPNIPIFPAVGNHEGVPSGSFPPPWVEDDEHSISWLYSELSNQWAEWLPNTVNNTVNHGAFYSVLIRPGFRLISLNTNYCINTNWFLVVNSTDPAQELEWLIYQLQKAEDKGEKVHIIGHIPPGNNDCLQVWSQNYYEIVDRYENTITAQFFGHKHSDEFEVFYDVVDHKRPTSIAYIGPSITTYENLNPGYRIYYVDGDHNSTTWEVLNHETWIANLEDVDESGTDPEWYRLYTAKEAYGMETLRPETWSKLIEKMAEDKHLFDLFYRFYFKDSPVRPMCGDSCRLQILCDLKSGKSHQSHLLCPEKNK